jgi:hypothetical protein
MEWQFCISYIIWEQTKDQDVHIFWCTTLQVTHQLAEMVLQDTGFNSNLANHTQVVLKGTNQQKTHIEPKSSCHTMVTYQKL